MVSTPAALGRFCDWDCLLNWTKENPVKMKKAYNKQVSKELKDFNVKSKTKSAWVKEAQINFNKFIRIRDVLDPCISCGRMDHEIEYLGTGGKWDCGHYRSRGAAKQLRFNEDNAHKQCKSCNGGSAKYAKKGETVGKSYTRNLIKKIGQEAVDRLKNNNQEETDTIESLIALKKYYSEKFKALQSNIN